MPRGVAQAVVAGAASGRFQSCLADSTAFEASCASASQSLTPLVAAPFGSTH